MIDKDLLKESALDFGVSLDDMALDRFELLEQRLVRWNNHINLTAITEPDEIVIKHFVDSLSIFSAVDLPRGASVIDVGCGAGFPGLPLLIARPDLDLTFLDSVGKKLSFIKEVMRYNGLMGDVVHDRAENIGLSIKYRESFDFAVTRAVAPLNMLAEYCLPLVKVGGMYVSMKGADNEVELGKNAIEKLGGKIENIVSLELPTGDKRNLILIRKISQTSIKYPRKSKKISSKPL
ncbi:MAG: 16S rRNA (guanine(527)-N(7))-methyltransferase RsmG [Eubacterium sp.]|nr:16S rRNA (guanine(527)-N(7))-methyltransferase RsmG [Eubacterium sp.]